MEVLAFAAGSLCIGFCLGMAWNDRQSRIRRSEDMSVLRQTVAEVAMHVSTAIAIPGGTMGTVKQADPLPEWAEPYATAPDPEVDAWEREMDDPWLRAAIES